jgi:hypothetical protein
MNEKDKEIKRLQQIIVDQAEIITVMRKAIKESEMSKE